MATKASSSTTGWLLGAALLAGALAAGCSSRTYRVDAVRHPDVEASGSAFLIVNGNPERDDADALVRKAGEYVRTALSAKGMYEAPEKVPPNVTVEVDFGSEAPKREVVRYQEPIHRLVREPGTYVTETYTDERGNTRTVTRYIPGPEYEVIDGWRDYEQTVVVHPKYLRITAREVPAEGDDRPPRELWSVYVTNEDQGADIERCLPQMVAAAMDAIGQSSSSERTIVLSEDDERVAFIKRGM